MSLGFHTISLLLHDEVTATTELARIGYRSVAIRPRLSGLNPSDSRFAEQMLRLAETARQADVRVVVDSHMLFSHDPYKWHSTGLASHCDEEAQAAQSWIEGWILATGEYFANQRDQNVVVFESGVANESDGSGSLMADETELERLAVRIDALIQQADAVGVRLAIRPRRGNVISRITHFQRLQQWLGGSHELALAADTGQMMLNGEFPIGERLSQIASSLAYVFLTDPETMTRDVVDQNAGSHLPGKVDLRRVVQSLIREEIHVPLIVQIDGQSERGLVIAQEAWENLRT
ncbi:MAG: TIM barrel protein [Pirellulaceae bacterium]